MAPDCLRPSRAARPYPPAGSRARMDCTSAPILRVQVTGTAWAGEFLA